MLKAIGSKTELNEKNCDNGYYWCVKDLLESDVVSSMNQFTHHGNTTCFQHCLNVSYYNYRVCKALGLNARSAARAGLLHDLFLYDWHTTKMPKGEALHGFSHPQKALNNAKQYFDLDACEQDIILKHMFPLTLTMPKYRETVVITIVDKYCGVLEVIAPKCLYMASVVSRVTRLRYLVINKNKKIKFTNRPE